MKRQATQRALLARCDEVSRLLGALAHPVRLKVLCQTMEGERSVGELTEFCGISQSGMSQFLARMRNDGLLRSRRDGTRVLYAVRDEKVIRLLQAIKEICT
jgi:ArsR family transcriptional regulator